MRRKLFYRQMYYFSVLNIKMLKLHKTSSAFIQYHREPMSLFVLHADCAFSCSVGVF
jgi:hypothetical protein